MSSNDQTPNDVTTKPTLEPVLERINAVAGSIAELRIDVDQRFNAVDQRFNTVDSEVASLRKDVERGFRGFERKLGYLANELVLQRRAEQDELLERIEALENKAS